MFPEKVCNHLKNYTNEAKLVYHFAKVLGNPAFDDCHRSVVDAMLQHYINKFKKATVDLITHKDVLTSASGIHQTMKDSSSKPLQPTKKPFPLSQGNDTSDDEEVESSCVPGMWSKVVEGVTIQGYYVNTTRSVSSKSEPSVSPHRKDCPQSVIRKAPPNNQRKQRRLTVKQLAANSKGIARSKAPSKDLTKPTASGSRIKDWVCPTGANLDLALQVEARRLDTLAASEEQKNIANADMIISQLPKLLGQRVRAGRAIESSMFINTDTCLDRAKAGGLINKSPTDPIIGSSFINREVLNPHHSSFKVVVSHPLYPCLSFTHEPLSQGWTRFIATLADIQSLLTKDRLALTLASLEGIEGNSDEALLKDYFGSHGGMAYFFEYIASALCALVSFRFNAVESRKERPTILSKATYEKKPNGLTKGLSCLAQLLVIGPGAIFSQPTARDLCPQWKTSMLLEFGAIAVETQTKNFLEPSGPIWSPFGNTRLHIIKTFAQMGFGHDTPIDWTLLLETFPRKLLLSSFGSRYLG
ncbi:hypothetical protein PSHT_09276 [Puccinia striiformis]|uniref:Uncharacterized protein n=1 Tax=Puccinia striiformis TaxID=27350 RepID=A0A2S4VI55_9BASI|nr:hypothetical protein PSHT_09276 [Puccinia striiformis]